MGWNPTQGMDVCVVRKYYVVRSEVFTGMTMKNVFRDVALCRSCVNRRRAEPYDCV
jgi:hypothetical protein